MSKKMKEIEFNEIDRDRLDDEWVNQERMIGYYAAKLADAERDREYAKVALDVKEAELGKKIRSAPEKYGLEKVTNEPVNAEICIRLEKSDERKNYIEAGHKVGILKAAIERLRARSKGISDLIFLHSIGYFGKPKTPRGMKKSDVDSMKDKRMARRVQERD
jgi:hypothetical protein